MSGQTTPFALALATVTCLSGTAQAGVIFTDDFESTVNTRNWQIYQQISGGDWVSTQGSGIEVQTSGTVVDAHSGNQYIELDSDRRRGGSGLPSNSAMTRTLTGLKAGAYELDYFYQARTDRQNDNTIDVYFDQGDTLFSTLVDTANGVGSNGWIQYTVPLVVGEDDANRRLSFRAGGIQNTLGGFVDTVSLTYKGNTPRIPGRVPEPSGLVLVGLALAGLARRRRR